jgi:cytochrome c
MIVRSILAATLFMTLSINVHAQDAVAGEKAFNKCRVCHQIGEAAKNSFGPVLNGLFGRKSGVIEGYNHSDANMNSGIT